MNTNNLEQLKITIRKILRPYKWLLLCIAVLLAVIMILILVLRLYIGANTEQEREVISVASLQKIVNVSELSTIQTVYNGVAEVKDEKAKTKYYVAYNAIVTVGIEFDKIEYSIDHDSDTIKVILPDVEVTDVNVDMSSLDFMFVKDKYNVSAVTQEAYIACENDVKYECNPENTIFDYARSNAVKAVTALLNPIVEQLDQYTLMVE